MTILEFKSRKKDHLVLECSSCQRQDFYLNADGSMECRGCGLLRAGLRHFDTKKYSLVQKQHTPNVTTLKTEISD